MQECLQRQPGLQILEGEVTEILVEGAEVSGVRVRGSSGEEELLARQVVVTTGTFLRGIMHCGFQREAGGRFGEGAAQGLSPVLTALGFTLHRLKTGTPPRLYRDSIDFSLLERQEGDDPPKRFSFSPTQIGLPQVACFLGYTNESTHAAIRANLDKSPLYSGVIQGVGPRYCPSIEDKVVKFPEKPRHQIFFEPESLSSDWIYPNGISTSLPSEVQEVFVRTLPGCSNVRFARYGYAVEYDCIDPRGLYRTLESRRYAGLFFGGQINGTSGYEEAAAQGLLAGINAALRHRGEEAFVPGRADSYLGVMVDDLTTQGISEPYRMFTSRAEFRLSLREDNADGRLTPVGCRIGLIDAASESRFRAKQARISQGRDWLEQSHVPAEGANRMLAAVGGVPASGSQNLAQLLRRPGVEWSDFRLLELEDFPALSPDEGETLSIDIKYAGYIALQTQEAVRLKRLEGMSLPEDLEFSSIRGLSIELREKLTRTRPGTLGQAATVSGVTPAALAALLAHLRGLRRGSEKAL